jgi:pilus assembly protein CpaE
MRVVITQEKTGQVEPIRHVVLGMGLECTPKDCVSFGELPVRLAQGPIDLLLVHVGSNLPGALDAMQQAKPLTKAPIMGVGPTGDSQQILQVMQGGAREYLDEANLQPALETALSKHQEAGTPRQGQGIVIGVVSATPGSGVTTVATNLAFLWAERHKDQVALAEFGRDGADLALSLDINPRHTVADLGHQWERMDANLLRKSMTSHAGGVQVLAYKPETLSVEPVDARAVRKAVLLMRTMYHAAVLDLGHMLGEEHFEAMRLCDHVAVVVRLDVPALRQARRFLRLLAERNLPRERIQLVANRYGQRGQIAWKKAEEALGARFVEYIPDDSGSVNSALNQGQPLVRVRRYGGITRRLGKLAALLNGRA